MKLRIGSALLVCGLGLVAIAGSAGCHPAKPVGPVAGLEEPVAPPTQPDLGHYPARVSVEVLNVYSSDSVFSVCKGPSPFFEFDSAHVGPEDKPTMQVVADCMIEGPLKGKNIELVGRTDPRGTEEYNEKLGLERAERVKAYLVDRGIPANRVATRSLGKEDASPAPKDWPADRRVEIRVAQ